VLDTKLKKFSHSIFVRTVVFILMLVGVAGSIISALNIYDITDGNLEVIVEDSYLESHSFKLDYNTTIYQLADLIDVYKSKDHILAGNTLKHRGSDYELDEYTEEFKQELINYDLEDYNRILNKLNKHDGIIYYATDGKHTFTNTKQTEKSQFKQYPAYYISEDYDWEMYPQKLEHDFYSFGFPSIYRSSVPLDTKIFVGYTKDYLDTISSDWVEKKTETTDQIYYFFGYVITFFISLIYLTVTAGRTSFKDKEVEMNVIDKLYVDLNLISIFTILTFWVLGVNEILSYYLSTAEWALPAITIPTVSILTVLFLSVVKHLKNRTFIKHTLLYTVCHSIYRFVKAIFDNGSLGMKVTIIVILYPLVTVASLVFLPITIGIAVWLALKQVNAFNKIQEGAKLMRDGNLHHQINIDGIGELATLATNINGINDNFKQAVHNEIKNERMKTELITNVSHDIRTPLTSLITYTDLLKTETDPEKMKEYIDILDQKSKRLKVLTDDLFAAAKASSGDIPVELQTIDVVALVNQGIGEVSEQISEKNFVFKLNYQEENMYVHADGKLLWRSVENILSNIFNYGLEGSRVYIDITYEVDQVLISFKNISKYELNISEDELMERFKRGDESRSSQGSGLGLSITKSLIENQNGEFKVSIDGDLFKSMIYLPRSEKSYSTNSSQE